MYLHSGWLFLYPKACGSILSRSVVSLPFSSMMARTEGESAEFADSKGAFARAANGASEG